jgi:hypothetical protein
MGLTPKANKELGVRVIARKEGSRGQASREAEEA